MAAVETKCAGYFTTSAQEEDDDGDDWGTKTLVLKVRPARPPRPPIDLASHPSTPRPHAHPPPLPSLSLSPTSSRTPSARRG